jgi:hypothetical protein
MLLNSYFVAPDALTRAWVVALATWPLVQMAHAAMRLVSIALMLGLATVNWNQNIKLRNVNQTEINKFHSPL